ncbi:uncharacterized protein PFL1_00543 [Pseudozyma flocculosa PF-1]|uniref:Uncharacterized protein n=1 Tax=Pseudozyma flocculosa TaxID=84751 RepID=A0A5C3ERH1_9BASI|nr:uncharacterized protein PFL1_00543 [Pseudozyma flocculosa PF-1]EPQ32347.1 hypothetical protein PFL1_00543 [Pseudozyma flocculosa PF-1]SPO34692.1 uncharacterized protein PSFLO_00163 [Pseudozyma flocculosa]
MAPSSTSSVRGFFSGSGTFGRGSSQGRARNNYPPPRPPLRSTHEDAEGAAFRRQRVHSFVQAGRAQLDAVFQASQQEPLTSSPETTDDSDLSPTDEVDAGRSTSAVADGYPFPLQRPGAALARAPTFRSRRASTATARTEFSVSSAINKGYSARIEIDGKVKPLASAPKRNACQTTAFLDGPGSLDKIYRPGQDVCGQVHLARCDPERGIITGIKARVRGDLETSVFGVGDASFYSGDNEHGIAKRQILFYSEQQTLVTKADIESGRFDLQASGLVDHRRKNNLAVPFKFALPIKIPATALDLLDNKLKASYKRGKKFVDLPPSICMETRYEPPRATQIFDKARERYGRHRAIRPMAHIKYEIDIIVTRQRLGSQLLPSKRGERLILSFQVEPYPPMTAALPVPNMDLPRLRRMRSNATATTQRSDEEPGTPGADDSGAQGDEEEEDSWTRDLGGYREPTEVFGALPRETSPARMPTRTASQVSVPRLSTLAQQPKVKKVSTVKVSEGMDGRLTGWLTHTVETEVAGIGGVEAILSVPATAAFYMETKVPFSVELRMPAKTAAGVEPTLELNLLRSVLTFSRLGTLTVESESPDCLDGFSGPESWSERIRILNLKRTSEDQLPPFYEPGRTRQMFGGDFVISRYERVLKPLSPVAHSHGGLAAGSGGGTHGRKGKPVMVPEFCLVTPSFSFKALRLEYRIHVKIGLTDARSDAPAHLQLVTPPVLVAGSIRNELQGEERPSLDASTPGLAPAATAHNRDHRHVRNNDHIHDHERNDDDDDHDATPLAHTPARLSVQLGGDEAPEYSPMTPPEPAAPSAWPRFDFPSLDAIPDEPEVDLDEELGEQIALGLITPERLAVVQERQAALDRSAEPRSETLLPSYGESSGIFDV